MKNLFTVFFGLLFGTMLFCPLISISQTIVVQNAVHADVSMPLRDMKSKKQPFWAKWKRENEMEVPNKFRTVPSQFTPDGALQTVYNNGNKSVATVPLVNFNGMTNAANTSRVTPPDPAGDVGPNHYVQVVNGMLQIFNKTGSSLYGPVLTSTLWNGFSGNWDGHNNGDAIVLYDENADRWLISQFAIDCTGSPYTEYEMIAISTTGDPTGTYYRYAFSFDYMPDYPKLGVWQDGYYMAVNRFNTNNTSTPYIGAGACVLERNKMLVGDASARMIYFKTETLGGSGSAAGDNCWAMMPSDCDGTLPPAGTPNYFAYIDGNNTAELRLWALHTDWTTTTNSTFTYVTALPVASYTGMSSVTEPGTQALDGLGDRLMFRNQYRNFGTYETFVTCHSVNTGSSIAGIRWYEYRKTGSAFSLYQQSTFAPGDGKSRWMGSIAMNASGDIGLAYSVASSTLYPSIYFTGRKASDPLNQMTIAEGIIQTGTVSMSSYSRWGDYSALNVDPSDNLTFWTTQEYVGTFGGWCPWATKIASFKFANMPTVVTTSATGITGTAATLNGTVNPNGLATTYYFNWGTTTSYGNTTTTASAGSGSTNVNVSANLTGLTAGTTYHFRLVGSNSDGFTNGNDMTFIPGAASVATTAANTITMNTATSGGTVNGDGGFAVTARGVCWSTSASPTVAGTHTTDGSGTGVFTSYLTGLTANTTYHIRAYATNANGTSYGDDLTFTTVCGIYTLPFTEGFSTTTIPSCWSQVDNAGNGQIWQFGVISGYTPLPALIGNYAFLNSDAYGSGFTQNADLLTPTINLSGYTAATLVFKHYFRSYTGSSGTVYYSINNGLTWVQLATYTTTSTSNPTTVTLAVNAAAGQSQVKFKWNYTGTYGYYWGIDEINITGTCTTVPVSVAIAASSNPVCAGTSITFTATPANGGTSPAYQWKVNGTNVGANSPTYTYIPVNNDVVTCVLTSSAACVSGNPATSNAITISVNQPLAAGVSIAPSSNPVCAGTSVSFTATPANGGAGPVYQWKVNGVNVGTNSASYSYTPVNNDVITCTLTSNAPCVSGNPANSNPVTMTVNPTGAASVSIYTSANNICAGTSVTFTPTPVNGGTPTYQWFKNSVAVGTGTSYSCVPVNGDLVYAIMTSSLACITGSPATSNTIAITVNQPLAVGVSIAPSSNPVCAETSVSFTATPSNGGSSPVYQWRVNGVNVGTSNATYSYTPANNDVITCALTSNASCVSGNPATSNLVTMSVNSLQPVSVSITASANNICAGSSVTFTPTPVNGGSPTYQWFKNAVAVGLGKTYTCIPVNGDQVYAIMTSSLTCQSGSPATSNTIIVTVNPILPASVSISPSSNDICEGTSITFTPTPVNGGTPTYQWFKNSVSVSTGSTYTCVPVDGDQIYAIMTSSLACITGSPAISNTVAMIVNPQLLASISIAPSANPVCAGTSVTYIAAPVNGGTVPVFQWRVNGTSAGTNSATFSYTPVNNDVITCVLTSNASCVSGNPAISTPITMSVNPLQPASVSISSSANNICEGTSVTFTPTPVNGGTPAYQWFKNAMAAGTGNIYTCVPADGDQIYAIMTSSLTCKSGSPATSNTVTITVNPILPVSVSILPSSNDICEGTSVTLTPTPVNGGSPIYQWVKNTEVVGTGNTYTYIPENGDELYAIMTSSLTCKTGSPATSNSVVMIVNPSLPVSIAITADANPVSAGSLTTFTATSVNGGDSPSYLWQVNAANVGSDSPVYSYVPLNGDVVTCILTSNATCAAGNPAVSNPVAMTVTAIPATIGLQNISVADVQCFNAIQTITVAGDETTFTVLNGGSATMIAGQDIDYLPGTKVDPGGYLFGYISTNGQYCNMRYPSMVSVVTEDLETPSTAGNSFFRIYPNPTAGVFSLELPGLGLTEIIKVELYGIRGEKILSSELSGKRTYNFSLDGRPEGIYLVHILSGNYYATARIIKKD